VKVQFIQGTEHTLPVHDVLPFALIPGARVTVNWPWWGPWTCTVVKYDAEKQRVKLYDGWGETKSFPVAEVYQAPKKSTAVKTRSAVYITLLSAGAAIGAVAGAVTVWALLR
jgi:hypothetical protein